MRPVYCRGLCRACYHRPRSRAYYRRKKHDPVWYAPYLRKINESKQRRAELKAAADLARLSAELESMR